MSRSMVTDLNPSEGNARLRSRSLPGNRSNRPQNNNTGRASEYNYIVRNISPLLDEARTKQLINASVPRALYTKREFHIIGSETDPHRSINLCKHCKDFLTSEYPPREAYHEGPVCPESWIPHHDTLLQLLDCALSQKLYGMRCQLCDLVWQGISHRLSYRRKLAASGSKVREMATFAGKEDCNIGLNIAIGPNRLKPIIFNVPCGPQQITLGYALPWFELTVQTHTTCKWADPNFNYRDSHLRVALSASVLNTLLTQLCFTSDENHSLKQSPLSNTTDSSQTFKQITEWLDGCDQNHTTCHQNHSTSHTPTRLLSINPKSKQVFLVDSKLVSLSNQSYRPATRTGYVALSYCWGKATAGSQERLMLRERTHNLLRAGVHISALPRTIQDACYAVIQLGFRTVWIDRFCIIQDSSEDWSREAAQMADTYKHASLVVMASCSEGEDEGFFRNRECDGGGILSIQVPFASLAHWYWERIFGSFCTLFVDREDDRRLSVDGEQCESDPLGTRAWAFQERILARRTVQFNKREVFWECQELQACEGNHYTDEHMNLSHRRAKAVSIAPGMEWCKLVNKYSRCDLTYPEDRLIALAGVSKEAWRAQRKVESAEDYLAGLWRTTFITDLCWFTWGHTEGEDTSLSDSTFVINFGRFSSIQPRERNKYVAPSWSWAGPDIGLGKAGSLVWRLNPFMDQLASLREARIETVNGDPFAPLVDGWAIIHGQLRSVPMSDFRRNIAQLREDGPDPNAMSGEVARSVNMIVEAELLHGSARDESQLPTKVYFMPIHNVQKIARLPQWQLGLILAPHGILKCSSNQSLKAPTSYNGQEFQRVGYVEIGPDPDHRLGLDGWLEETPTRDILIR